MTDTFQHISVLLHESIDGLAIKPDGIYIDGTFGRGGHSRTILSKLGETTVACTVLTEIRKLSRKRVKLMIHVLLSFMVLFQEWRIMPSNMI